MEQQLLEKFDPFTPKRSIVTSFCPDAERESETGHHSRTSTRLNSDDTATVINLKCYTW